MTTAELVIQAKAGKNITDIAMDLSDSDLEKIYTELISKMNKKNSGPNKYKRMQTYQDLYFILSDEMKARNIKR